MTRQQAMRIGLMAFGVVILALVQKSAMAQRPPKEPHLAYAFPAGCRQGTSCEVVLGGQNLKEVGEAYVAGRGVQVEVLGWYRPMTRGEYNQLRMKLSEAKEKLIAEGKLGVIEDNVAKAAGVTKDQLREMEIFRERDRDPKRQPNSQLEEELTVKLTVNADAKPGKRELRLISENAMSNPIWIQVGQFEETRETEPNDIRPDRKAIKTFPLVVNGQIMPGDVDCFTFTAKQGQKLVIAVGARDVIPYLADAVPGWFQAAMKLTDSEGKEVSYADSFHYRQDPVLYFEVPRDGDYTIKLHDTLFRGREDFVYRLKIGEIPFVTSIFPLGAQCESRANVELEGWNLTRKSLEVKTMSRNRFRPVHWCTVPQGDGTDVTFPLQVDRLPEVFDKEPNNTIADSQQVRIRTNINGRIDQPGDQDVYFISGRGRLVAEVHARRHGTPLDSMLVLTDANGKEIATNDDHEDKSHGLLTHHADSRLEAVIPSPGAYLHISDAQRNGGRDFVYRLSLRAPEPDYELRVTPGNIIARPGAVIPITVHALRKDGFDSDIELALEDPPEGFRLSGGIVPGNADRVQLTLTASHNSTREPVNLNMISRARRKGRSWIQRTAIPAENMMQAFIWHHLIPVEDWTVVVSGRSSAPRPFEIVPQASRISLPKAGQFILPVRPLVNVDPKELQVSLDEPKGVSAEIVIGNGGEYAVKLTTNGEEVEPGLQGNLLIYASREVTPAASKTNPNPQPRRTAYGYLPAIPFEISTIDR